MSINPQLLSISEESDNQELNMSERNLAENDAMKRVEYLTEENRVLRDQNQELISRVEILTRKVNEVTHLKGRQFRRTRLI